MDPAVKLHADGVRNAAFNRSSLNADASLLVVWNSKGQPPDEAVYPKNQTAFVSMPGKFIVR